MAALTARCAAAALLGFATLLASKADASTAPPPGEPANAPVNRPAAVQTLTERIDAYLAQPRFAAASWGIAVVDLDTGRTVYAHDPGRLLIPASTGKLFTAAFALDTLGPAYRTHTDVLAAGDLRRGRLRGPLVLRGRGDPTLAGTDWADRLAAQVHARGIERIDGGVVGDDTAFGGSPIGRGWEASDLQATYGAGAGGLDIDENTLSISASGGHATVTPDDAALTVAASTVAGPTYYRAPGSATVHVLNGAIDATAPTHARLALPDPALTAARRLQVALEKQGIRVNGEARSVRWPVAAPTGDVMASEPSPPLNDVLRAGLKRSQNLYLQSVFLLTGLEGQAAIRVASPDSETRAANALAAWLASRGMGPTSVHMDEGSGLSRHDLTTPAALVQLLSLMDHGPGAAAWRDLLPVAGVDGTLAKRMRGTAAEGNLHAKTGSMSLVNTLAGYATTRGGQHLAVAIMVNNYVPPPEASAPVPSASADIDAIAVMLTESLTP